MSGTGETDRETPSPAARARAWLRSLTMAPRWSIAVATALLGVALELEGIVRADAPPVTTAGVLALSLASFAVHCIYLVPLVTVLGVPVRWLARRIPKRTSRWWWLLALFSLLAALAVHAADTTLYVRLYPEYHLALGAAKVLALLVAVALLHLRRVDDERPRLAPWRPLATAAALLAFALVASHGLMSLREDAKAALMGHGSTTARLAERLTWLTDWDGDGYGWLYGDTSAGGTVFAGIDCPVPVADSGRLSATEALAERQSGDPLQPLTRTPDGQPLQPNIVFIMVDALRYDHALEAPLGPILMPAVTQLAEQSVVFSRAYATASWTMPSVYSMVTSRLPWAFAWTPTGITRDRQVVVADRPKTWPRTWQRKLVATPIADRHPTIAEVLSAAGWHTAAFPVQENLLQAFGLTRGFEHYDNWIWKQRNRGGGALTGALEVTAVLDYLRARDASTGPFFVWVHLYDPHHPYQVPPGVPAAGDSALDRYRAEVVYTDQQIGRLLSGLTELGLDDSTAVVLMADHGEEFGDHGAGYHSTSLYEELIRVPLLIRAPGVPAARIDQVVSLLDLAPTLARLVGLQSPTSFQGRDLTPLLQGQSLTPEPVFAETMYRGIHELHAVITERDKLVFDRRRGFRELFDLQGDPEERRNLVSERESRADELLQTLCRTLQQRGGLAVTPALDP